MIRHASLQNLSSYVDNELNDNERAEVRLHLLECPKCQERVQGLRRVIERLEQVQQSVAPEHLGGQVRGRIRWAGQKQGLRDAFERSVAGWLQIPNIVPVAAVVMALATIGVMFVAGLQRRDQPTIPVILNPVVPHSPDESLLPESAAQSRATKGESLKVGGREFLWKGEGWLELGQAEIEPEVRVVLDTPEGRTWLANHPEWKDLEHVDAPIRLKLGPTLVEVVPPDGSP